jgi:hypothetical protein
MQFLLLFSLTSFLSFFQFDGLRGDIQQPQAKQEVLCVGVKVPIKAFLEGPFINTASSVLMFDNLRTNSGAAADGSQNLIPTTEPYSSLTNFTHSGGGGGEITTAAVLSGSNGTNTGANAIVDWVFIELRDPANAATVMATRSALLKANGTVVDVDGTNPVTFATTNCGNFFVTIRHRNHFGVRTNAVVALTNDAVTTAAVDFTVASPAHGVFGTGALKTLTTSGALVMFAGDANSDGTINALDRNFHWRLQNGGTYVINGGAYTYLTLTADFNLSGTVNALDRNFYWRLNNGIIQQL